MRVGGLDVVLQSPASSHPNIKQSLSGGSSADQGLALPPPGPELAEGPHLHRAGGGGECSPVTAPSTPPVPSSL